MIRPGIVRLPAGFDAETLGRFRKLIIVKPPPEIIVAAKLVRGAIGISRLRLVGSTQTA